MNENKPCAASVEDLVLDEQFKQAVLHASGDNAGYISCILVKCPELKPAVEEARHIVLRLYQHYARQKQRLSKEDDQAILKHIRQKNNQ